MSVACSQIISWKLSLSLDSRSAPEIKASPLQRCDSRHHMRPFHFSKRPAQQRRKLAKVVILHDTHLPPRDSISQWWLWPVVGRQHAGACCHRLHLPLHTAGCRPAALTSYRPWHAKHSSIQYHLFHCTPTRPARPYLGLFTQPPHPTASTLPSLLQLYATLHAWPPWLPSRDSRSWRGLLQVSTWRLGV